MNLYHSSYTFTRRLEPQLGARRHIGEAPSAVGLPVVWLANVPMLMEDSEGNVATYRFLVEVPNDDPDLHLDEGLAGFMESADEDLESPITLRWYYLTRGVDVVEAYEWDDQQNEYVLFDGG